MRRMIDKAFTKSYVENMQYFMYSEAHYDLQSDIDIVPMYQSKLRPIHSYIKKTMGKRKNDDRLQMEMEIDEGTKNTILTLIAVVAAIGPLLFIIGKLALAINVVISLIPVLFTALTFLAAHPIVAILILIIGLFTLLYFKSEKFRNAIDALVEGMKKAIEGIPGLIENIVDGIEWMINKTISMINKLINNV